MFNPFTWPLISTMLKYMSPIKQTLVALWLYLIFQPQFLSNLLFQSCLPNEISTILTVLIITIIILTLIIIADYIENIIKNKTIKNKSSDTERNIAGLSIKIVELENINTSLKNANEVLCKNKSILEEEKKTLEIRIDEMQNPEISYYKVCKECGEFAPYREGINCCDCGGKLIDKCSQCGAKIIDDSRTKCPTCGKQYSSIDYNARFI